MGKYIINFFPTDQQISEIEKWLKEEDSLTGKGFYCKWDDIISMHNRDELITITHQGRAVGFLAFNCSSNKTLYISYAEIRPSYRKIGVGRKLMNDVLEHFKNKGFAVAYLQCSPITSKPFWKRLGFIEYPDPLVSNIQGTTEDKYLFKILTDCLESNNDSQSSERIELWNDKRHRTTNSEPKYVWKPEFVKGNRRLAKPIIHPADCEWRIRWFSKGKEIFDQQIKKFVCKIEYENFIVIDELPYIEKIMGNS